MLLDCRRLDHWRWEECIERLFSMRLDYGDWMSLRTEDPETIDLLEEEWNHFDTLDERAWYTAEVTLLPGAVADCGFGKTDE